MSDVEITQDAPGRLRLTKSADGNVRKALQELRAVWQSSAFQDHVKGVPREDVTAWVAGLSDGAKDQILGELVVMMRNVIIVARHIDPFTEG